MVARDNQGRFSKENFPRKVFCERNHVEIDHNYTDTLSMCNGQECCSSGVHIDLPNNVKRNGWRTGMRVLDLGFLLDNLKHCSVCRLRPVPLTSNSVVGELRKGLGGFLYVKCQNIDCGEVNRVAYCKTHRVKKRGMPYFSTNTNLGIGYVKNFHRPENKLIAVHCPETFTNVTTMSPGRVSDLIKECNKKLDSLKTKILSKMTDTCMNGEFKTIGLEGDMKPGQAIVEYAEKVKACFIVTRTRGMGKFRRTLMDSASDYIIHHSPCPVLVCRQKY